MYYKLNLLLLQEDILPGLFTTYYINLEVDIHVIYYLNY